MRLGTKWNIAVALGVAVLCVAIVGVTLLLVQERGDSAQAIQELGQREQELAQARADLQQAQARQDPRMPALEQARQQLEGRNVELSAQVTLLEEERDELKGTVEFLQHGRRSLRGAITSPAAGGADPGDSDPTTAAREEAGEPCPGAGAGTQESPSEAESGLIAENRGLRTQVQQLEAEVSRLEAANRAGVQAGVQAGEPAREPTGEQAGGNVASLEARAAELRAQIASLEQQEDGLRAVLANLEEDRKALAVRPREMFPICSGSMEPKITCLDTVVLLENFLPQDIEVGTVISFIPPAEEGEVADSDAAPVLHRVLDIKQENGIYHFWPKGDAWEDPDGYWVPETSLLGYVIELLPGTRPQNADLRDLVDRTRDRYAATRDRMAEARDGYDNAVITHCGSLEAVSSCQATPEGFAQVADAYDRFSQAWDAYVAAVCEYDKAYFHGLHESEPKDSKELTPYTAPAQCGGTG